MDFENTIRASLGELSFGGHARAAIDSIKRIDNGDGTAVWYASFFLTGSWGSPARFTFPFDEAVPIEESLVALTALVTNSWQRVQLPPPGKEDHAAAGASGD